MTATIRVPELQHATKRLCTRDRYNDYAEALTFWTQLGDERISGIVFCDNSGASLDPLRNLKCVAESKRPVEWHQFGNNVLPAGLHYGFAELGIVDQAIQSSKLLSQREHFAKVTGRLKFPRISSLMNELMGCLDVAVDCRRAYRKEKGASFRVRTELMFFAVDFYRSLLMGRREEMIGLCSHIEEYLAHKLQPFRGHPGVMLRFPVECPPIGVSGAFNSDYSTTERRLKAELRSLCRRVAPWLWI